MTDRADSPSLNARIPGPMTAAPRIQRAEAGRLTGDPPFPAVSARSPHSVWHGSSTECSEPADTTGNGGYCPGSGRLGRTETGPATRTKISLVAGLISARGGRPPHGAIRPFQQFPSRRLERIWHSIHERPPVEIEASRWGGTASDERSPALQHESHELTRMVPTSTKGRGHQDSRRLVLFVRFVAIRGNSCIPAGERRSNAVARGARCQSRRGAGAGARVRSLVRRSRAACSLSAPTWRRVPCTSGAPHSCATDSGVRLPGRSQAHRRQRVTRSAPWRQEEPVQPHSKSPRADPGALPVPSARSPHRSPAADAPGWRARDEGLWGSP